MTQETFPEFMFSFYDKDGEEVGDRVFAADQQRAEALVAVFPQLAPKKAVGWYRWRVNYVDSGDIKRGAK